VSGADIAFGVFLVVVGAAFCFQGYLTLRLLIPIWGALAGFSVGAGIVAAVNDERFLATALGWVVGLVVAVVFALVAYLYYAVSVVIAMGAIGFLLGTSAMYAFDVRWQWLIVTVGILAGAVLALLAVAADLPMVLLVVLSALGGASAIVGGAMLLTGALDTDQFTSDEVIDVVDHDWWWTALYVVLAVAGIVVQTRATDRWRVSMRQAWDDDRRRTGPAA
jgi:hypothetical protein